MSLVVNTNVGSLNAQRSLAASGAELKTAMERLSSGKKINSAADDAAGFAIAERMTAQIRGLNVATKNANDGLSMLAVIENATDDVTDMLQRIRELAVQASNDTNSSVDRAFLQEEVSQLVQEIDRVGTQTRYNGLVLLDGSFQNKSIQVGTEAGQTVSASVESIRSGELGQIENLSYLGDLAAGEASNIAYALENNPDPWMFTVYLADSAIELQRGDVIKFGTDASSHSYIVDSAHSEDGKYRINFEERLRNEDMEAVANGTRSIFLNNSISTTILSSAGWSVGTGESGETLVVAQGEAYTTLKNLGGLTVDDQIGAYKFLTDAAVWEPSWVDDDGASISFPPKNASGTESLANFERFYKISENLDSLHDIDLVNNAGHALKIASASINQLADQRASLGALQNRLEYTVSNLMNVVEFTTSARSRIEDADFAAESARLAKAQVLQQTGAAMLAQANAQPQLVLSLIR